MRIVKIKLEYKCFPVWIYDENNELLENDLPPYLIGHRDIDPEFVRIQEVYNGLFLDNETEFKYIGFKDAEKREQFLKELFSAIELLKSKLTDEYIIEDNTDILGDYII